MTDRALQTRNVNAELPTTRWSIVQAMGAEGTRRHEALERFARDYWPAIYAFARKKGHRPPEAEDLTQGFLLELIERESFTDLSRDHGRFRSWLLASLHNFLRKDWRDKNREKRGGGVAAVSIDRDLGEDWLERSASDEATPDVIFDRRWAAGILERALNELALSYQRSGKSELARILAPTIAGPAQQQGYAEAARKLGMSEPNARMAAFRMRKRLRSLVREEVAATVGSPAEVDAELDHLFTVFGSHPVRPGI